MPSFQFKWILKIYESKFDEVERDLVPVIYIVRNCSKDFFKEFYDLSEILHIVFHSQSARATTTCSFFYTYLNSWKKKKKFEALIS